MSRVLKLLLLGAALCTAAGRPACCVADIFVPRGCCAEAVAIEEARHGCSCCQRAPADPGTETVSRGAPSHRADCDCCAQAPVATHPDHGAGGRLATAELATASPVDLVVPTTRSTRRTDAPSPGERAPPVPRFAPLLL